ncbi:hypothetical protein [Helicobacter sp. T3_23-1056]
MRGDLGRICALLLENFAQKYHCTDIVSNYISFNDNSIKKDSREIYVSNYKA